jgi:PAS domain S-box-containing protein
MILLNHLRENLNAKLLLAIWVVLGLVISVFLYIQVRMERRAFLNQVIENAHRFSNTVKSSTRNDMLNDRRENVQRIIEAVAREEGVSRVRIFNKQGVLMLSTRQEEVGQTVDKQAEACFGCHAREQPLRRLSMKSRTRIFSGPDSVSMLGIINPIYNEPSCYTAACHAHPKEVNVLGVLDIDMSLSKMEGHVRERVIWIAVFSILLYLSLSATLYLLILFLVIRPVNRLTEGARRMARGDFDVFIPAPSRDQMGKLAQAFNLLSSDLKTRTRDLLEKRKDYQALIQSITNYVMTIDADYRIIKCNELVEKDFFGNGRETCYQILNARREPCPECPVRECFEKGRAVDSLETVTFKDGRRASCLVKATPVKNDLQEVMYVIWTATDISETLDPEREGEEPWISFDDKRFAERIRELQTSEKRYRTLFEYSLDTILLLNEQLKIIEINPAGSTLLEGYGKEAIQGRESFRVFFGRGRNFEIFRNQLLRKGVVRDFETILKPGPGKSLPVLISANALVGEKGLVTSYEVIIRDIHSLKVKEEALKQQNLELTVLNEISRILNQSLLLEEILEQVADKLMEVLEGNSLRIYLLDEKKEYLNLTVYRGLTKVFISKSPMQRRRVGDGLLGRAASTRQTIVVDNFGKIDTQYKEDLDLEALQSAVYIPLVSKGVTLGVLSVTSHLENKFSQQDVKFLSAIGQPIGLAIENSRLYQETLQAYEELKTAHEHALHREKLASLGRLAATVAHEINNPITSVLTYIKLMIKILAGGRFPEARLKDFERYLATMEAETTRCGEIVKNLLEFSRQTKPKIEAADLSKVIDLALTLMAHEFELQSIAIKKEFDPDLPLVCCDAKQIQQVVINLLGNAIEAMPEGGTVTLGLFYQPKSGRVILEIKDTGVGIPPEDQEAIFEPFFTTKEEGRGVGLGLSLVHNILTKHGGTIQVLSQPDQGTQFIIGLPVNARGAGGAPQGGKEG